MVSLKCPSSATGPSPFGSMGLSAGQVMTQIWTNFQIGLSVLRRDAKFTPTTHPPNKIPTPATTMVKLSLLSLFRTTKWWPTIPRLYHLPQHHPLVPAWCNSLRLLPPLREPRATLLAPALSPAPTSPAAQPPPSECPGAGPHTPVPRQTLGLAHARSAPLLRLSSTVASAVTTAQAAGRPYIRPTRSGPKTFAWCPKHSGGSQSLKRRDQLKGGSWGQCKATEGHGPPGHGDAPATLPSPLPQPTLGCHDLGACGGQARPSGWLAQTGNEVRRP